MTLLCWLTFKFTAGFLLLPMATTTPPCTRSTKGSTNAAATSSSSSVSIRTTNTATIATRISTMTTTARFSSPILLTRLHAVANDDNDNEQEQQQQQQLAWSPPNNSLSSLSSSPSPSTSNPLVEQTKENFLRYTLRRLAELSLEDYEWRSSVFKAQEADRMIEMSIARMRGQDPNYLRPMDAKEDIMGPLGKWEKSTVEWLSSVVEEESRRAQTIVQQQGKMVRPFEGIVLGPLGFLEKAVVDFLNKLRNSEKERIRTNTLRPKDLDVTVRGPLGDLEQEAVRILKQIEVAETLRAQQSKSRGGEVVRPIDVPGPLGDLELAVSELFQAEKLRSLERKQQGNNGKVIRPKDAKFRGPLGDAEYQAYEAIKQLNQEEMNRLESIQKLMQDRRPMEANRDSPLGILEAIAVGILRAPRMLMSVVERVKELLSSSELPLSESDQQKLLLSQRQKEEEAGEGDDDARRQGV